jgi:flagellar hook-length control protein FliK
MPETGVAVAAVVVPAAGGSAASAPQSAPTDQARAARESIGSLRSGAAAPAPAASPTVADAVAPTTPAPAGVTAVAAPAPTAATASTTPAAPTNSAPPTADLSTQLSRPLFTLASAGRGEHVMTVHVTPDALGPVTVRAHVGADGVRVELFAPTDTGRDALRAILPDLRRDLSGAGLGGSLDLSSQNQPSPGGDDRPGWTQNPVRRQADDGDGRPRASTAHDQTSPAHRLGDPIHTIDLVV